MTRPAKTVPAIDLFLPSAKIIKDNIGIFFILLVIPLLLTLQTGTPSEIRSDASAAEIFKAMIQMISPAAMVGSFLSLALYPFVSYTLRQAAKNGSVSLSEVISGGLRFYMQLLGIVIITAALVTCGLLLFVIPGLIALRSFVLAPYYLIDGNGKRGIKEALAISAKHSKQYKWSIYSIVGIILLFGFLSAFGLPGQIAGTILGLLYTPAFALRYQEIAR